MNRMKLLKRATLSAVVITTTTGNKDKGDDTSSTIQKVKPSELPIYGETLLPSKPELSIEEPSVLEAQIATIRKELWVWNDKYKTLRQEVMDVVETGLAHTTSSLDYLKEESNYLPRYGAIAISGLAGVVLGLRGGKIKKLTYGTISSLAMASLCYPREAAEISQESLEHAKKYLNIGYNFVYGVKPDYIKLPEPGKLLPDEGADVKKSSTTGVVKPSLFETMKTSFLDITQLASKSDTVTGSKTETKPASVDKTPPVSDQSHPEDKDLYTTRK